MNATRRICTTTATMQQRTFRDLYRLGVEVVTLPHFLIVDLDDSGH